MEKGPTLSKQYLLEGNLGGDIDGGDGEAIVVMRFLCWPCVIDHSRLLGAWTNRSSVCVCALHSEAVIDVQKEALSRLDA